MDSVPSPTERMLGRNLALPTFPAVVARLMEILVDPTSSVRDAAAVIEADPALTARVLRVVNSPAYGLRRKVTSVQHGVSLLGFGALRGIVLSVSVYDTLVEGHKAGALNKALFWQHCLATATAARAIARASGRVDAEDAWLAGLLHDVGKIMIDRERPEEFQGLQQRLGTEDLEGHLAERELFGTDHAAVGALLLERWHMPETLVHAVRLHHHLGGAGRQTVPPAAALLAAVIAAADFVTWGMGMGSMAGKGLPRLDGRLRALVDLDRLDLASIGREVSEELTRLAEVFHLYLPEHETLQAAMERATIEGGHLAALHSEVRRQLDLRVRELHHLNETVKLARATLDSEEVKNTVVGVVQGGLGFDRATYFAVDWEGRWIGGREVRDNSQMEPRSSEVFFAVGPEDGFLSRCALESAPFVIRSGAEQGLAARLLHFFDVPELVVAPVSSRSRLTGIVLVDNAFSGAPLVGKAIESLAVLAAEGGQAMESALLYEKMREVVIRDEVTGLSNRRHLMESLQYEMERCRRYQRPLAVALISVDCGQVVLERRGTAAAQRHLLEVAEVLRLSSRDVDMPGRYDQNEFVVLLPETPVPQARIYAERVREATQRRGEALGAAAPEERLTVSIALVEYAPQVDPSRQALMQRAARVLEGAQRAGKNRVHHASDEATRVER